MDMEAELAGLDADCLSVLQQLLTDNEALLPPGLRSFLAKLKSASSTGPEFMLPTPSSTPSRHKTPFTSSTGNDQQLPRVESDPQPDVFFNHSMDNGQELPGMESDAEMDAFFRDSAVDKGRQSDVDSDADVDTYFAAAAGERDLRRAERRQSRLESDEEDDEYVPEEHGRTAAAGRRRRRRRSRSRSCHRGGVAVPPSAVAMNVDAGDSMDISSSDSLASSELSTLNVTLSSSSAEFTNLNASAPSSGPYTLYQKPHLQPLAQSFIRSISRVAGKGLKLLEDEAYRATWVGNVLSGEMTPVGEGNDLAVISNRCYCASAKVAQAQFARMIAMVALAAKIQSFMQEVNESYLTRLWDGFIAPYKPKYTFNTWRRWYENGVTWARCGQAGGVYLMLLVVHAGEVSVFENVGINSVSTLAYVFRQLTEGVPISPLVLHILRPLVECLQREFPLNSVSRVLDARMLGIVKDNQDMEDLQHWSASDKFFGAFRINHFVLPKRIPLPFDEQSISPPPSSIPTPVSAPASPYRLPPSPASPSEDTSGDDVLGVMSHVQGLRHHKVETALNLLLPQNSFKLRAASASKTVKYTEEQRALASVPVEPKNLKDFEKRLKKQLKQGYRVDPSSFILYDRRKLLGPDSDKFVHLMDAQKQPFAISLPPIPRNYRDRLMAILEATFPNIIQNQDSQKGARPHRFSALHCTIYNRSARRGHDAPVDGVDDPWRMDKTGQKRSDLSQSMPRMAKEGNNDERWDSLKSALEPITDFLTEQMRILIPEFTVLDAYIDFLPGCAQPSVYHFGGVVINLNACTRAHRDHGDKNICLVLTAHEGEGAELVLEEPGVVVRTYTGDSFIFQSCRVTHYNLHYTGKRASIVFHTDRDGSAWAKDRNGWLDKPYFN